MRIKSGDTLGDHPFMDPGSVVMHFSGAEAPSTFGEYVRANGLSPEEAVELNQKIIDFLEAPSILPPAAAPRLDEVRLLMDALEIKKS